jgi:2-succinyl-5-enolpyruvyl-6-hydroxy-3-cyclohexene-1-carboxylate synthase
MQDYDRVFGTPHGLDLVKVARALGWTAELVTEDDEFAEAIAQGGPRVIVVRTDQRADADVLRSVRAVQNGTSA